MDGYNTPDAIVGHEISGSEVYTSDEHDTILHSIHDTFQVD